MQDPYQYTTEKVKVGLNKYWLALAKLIRRHAAQYAAVIGLTSSGPQFEQDLVDAFQWCHLMHTEAKTRRRVGATRKELLRIQREAMKTGGSLSRLRHALNNLAPQYRELLDQQLESVAKVAVSIVAKQTPWFHALSSVADFAGKSAERLKGADKGGAPKMLAFEALVKGLARAFENAKNRPAKVTWNDHTGHYGGEFMSLIEAVLPLAERWAGTPERPMVYPNSLNGRGKYVYALTRAGAGKRKRATQVRRSARAP